MKKYTDVFVNVTDDIFIVETIMIEAIFIALSMHDLEHRPSVCVVNSILHKVQKENSLFFNYDSQKFVHI